MSYLSKKLTFFFNMFKKRGKPIKYPLGTSLVLNISYGKDLKVSDFQKYLLVQRFEIRVSGQ